MLFQSTKDFCGSIRLKRRAIRTIKVRDGYFDLFVSLADAVVSKEVQNMFVKRLGAHFGVNVESSRRDDALLGSKHIWNHPFRPILFVLRN